MSLGERLVAWGLFVAVLGGCSGDAFQLAGSGAITEAPADGGGLPPLVSTRGNGSAAEGGGGLDSGSTDTNVLDTQPEVPPVPLRGPCGDPRVSDPTLADAEVCIASGTFIMGATATAVPAGYISHTPPHSVTLSAYFIDAYEVSVARYRRCVAAGACVAPSNTSLAQGCTYSAEPVELELHPVTCVSWDDAEVFCRWDAARRLPTEAEWERAARGAASSIYPWGDTFACSRAVLAGVAECSEHAGPSPKAVGSTPAGASLEGAYDLVGNAAEWVADWAGPYTAASAQDPVGPATASTRVQRGGGWQTAATTSASYARRAETPAAIGPFGFRCARDAAP
jgi:formylglycine-generating enzyme required for sulfatase activity